MNVFRKQCNPDIILKKIEEIKSINNENKATFSHAYFGVYAELLLRMIRPMDEVPEAELRRIATLAIFSVGNRGVISQGGIGKEISRLVKEYMAHAKSKFYLVTSISISNKLELSDLHVRDCVVTFCKNLSSKMAKARENIVADAKYSIYGEPPSDYMFAVVTVYARSHSEAADKALDGINIVRAIWNYSLNYGGFVIFSSGKRKPVNKVLLGPIHTLHTADGEGVSDVWWYDPDYREYEQIVESIETVDKIVGLYKKFRGLLAKSNYAYEIEDILIRYTCALDATDYNSSFLSLWGILETITSSSNYECLVERTAFVFSDVEFAKQELRLLKDYRNRFVHEGKDTHLVETLLYRLKHYVEVLLRMQVANKGFFQSPSAFSQFLSSPSDVDAINMQLKILRKAKSFVKPS